MEAKAAIVVVCACLHSRNYLGEPARVDHTQVTNLTSFSVYTRIAILLASDPEH
jgi:hypothetical protein